MADHRIKTAYLRAFVTGAMAVLFSSAASAHTGLGTAGFLAGIFHPFGVDHFLAIVAVGVWSVRALPGRAWMGPACFMTFLVAGSLAGVSGWLPGSLDALVLLSVVMFGLMLFCSRRRMPAAFGLALVAAAAFLHGLAHGGDAMGADFYSYVPGFLLSTAVLHFSAIGFALVLRRISGYGEYVLSRMLGAACVGLGGYLYL